MIKNVINTNNQNKKYWDMYCWVDQESGIILYICNVCGETTFETDKPCTCWDIDYFFFEKAEEIDTLPVLEELEEEVTYA